MSNIEIKLHDLKVQRFKALSNLELPRDAFGWGDEPPNTLLLGGANGAGKTSLLELIFDSIRALAQYNHVGPDNVWQTPDQPLEAEITFELSGLPYRFLRIVEGMQKPGESDPNTCDVSIGTEAKDRVPKGPQFRELHASLVKASGWAPESACGTGVLYIPSGRSLTLPDTKRKTPGKLEEHEQFAWRWSQPNGWDESVEALLYSARWADLNAKDRGKPATHFAAYQEAFKHFFGDDKALEWTDIGELVVVRKDGVRHSLAALSSGEKQVLVMCAEINRRWRPGSLVLIDEPELHLHEHWLTVLWTFLEKMQIRRGGQLIAATQSDHLFRIANSSAKVILGRK